MDENVDCHSLSDDTNDQNDNVLRSMINQLAEDYWKYFAIDRSSEISSFEETLEEKLMHLEEFCGFLDVVREENDVCLQQHLPVVLAKNAEMESLYQSVDQLHEMIAVIKKCVEDMESEVSKAEELFGNSKIKSFFTSFWNNKRKLSERRPKYVEPKMFTSKDFLCLDEERSSETSDRQDSNSET